MSAKYSFSAAIGIRMEQASPSAVAAKKIFSIQHHIEAKPLSELKDFGANRGAFCLKKGSIRHPPPVSMVYCFGIAS